MMTEETIRVRDQRLALPFDPCLHHLFGLLARTEPHGDGFEIISRNGEELYLRGTTNNYRRAHNAAREILEGRRERIPQTQYQQELLQGIEIQERFGMLFGYVGYIALFGPTFGETENHAQFLYGRVPTPETILR